MTKPYFENLVSFNNLYLDFVFNEYECEPILFVCKDDKGKPYLCLCIDLRETQRWIVSKTNASVLMSMLKKDIDIYTAFKLYESKKVVVKLMLDNTESSKVVEFGNIDKADLPEKNVMLRYKDADYEFYLKKITGYWYNDIFIEPKHVNDKNSYMIKRQHPYVGFIKATNNLQSKHIEEKNYTMLIYRATHNTNESTKTFEISIKSNWPKDTNMFSLNELTYS